MWTRPNASPASMIAVATGESDLSFAGMSGALPLVRSGRLRAIAVTGEKRWPTLPEIPTVAESGVPGFESSAWDGVLAPAGTPEAELAGKWRLSVRQVRRIAATAQEQEARHQFAEPCPVHHLEVARAKALHPTSLPRKEGA